jgi:cold shock protein
MALVVRPSCSRLPARQYRFDKEDGRMPRGNVKKLVQDRGFGFIAAEDGVEYFFHRSGLVPPLTFDGLQGGEAVVFDIQTSDKGPRAYHVRPD